MTTSIIESTTESTIFWAGLIVVDIIWLTFFLISFLTFSFKWMVNLIFILKADFVLFGYIFYLQTIILVAIMLNFSNTYGFLKCKYGSEKNMQSMATNFFGRQMLSSVSRRHII